MDNHEKLIKDAQYRKGLSIAFFNATNSAISLVGQMDFTEDNKKKVQEWRDFFISEHADYYAKVIENVGNTFNPKDTIKKLEKAKNYDELKKIWVMLSQDERNNEDIQAKVKDLKSKYEKA